MVLNQVPGQARTGSSSPLVGTPNIGQIGLNNVNGAAATVTQQTALSPMNAGTLSTPVIPNMNISRTATPSAQSPHSASSPHPRIPPSPGIRNSQQFGAKPGMNATTQSGQQVSTNQSDRTSASPQLKTLGQPQLQNQMASVAAAAARQSPQQLQQQIQQVPTGPSARPNPPAVQVVSSSTKASLPLPPIPDTLEISPIEPVPFKPEKPTLSSGHAICAPALTTPVAFKAPTFDLGGEHVLGKRKLRELVHSVIGVDNERMIDGNVEETLFGAADEFVQSVTSFACRLAKHRKSNILEPKDLQLHLERNWNIRIPGYSSDEVRSIRRFAPTSSYNQKISGINMNRSVDRKG